MSKIYNPFWFDKKILDYLGKGLARRPYMKDYYGQQDPSGYFPKKRKANEPEFPYFPGDWDDEKPYDPPVLMPPEKYPQDPDEPDKNKTRTKWRKRKNRKSQWYTGKRKRKISTWHVVRANRNKRNKVYYV